MDLAALSNDELIDQVTTWAGRVAVGEARLLALVGELDAREAWAVHGVRSCAHWLTWRIGWTSGTARERVRVARALRGLPLTVAALAEGRVSYAQVRALTRCVTAADEQVWLDLARHSTAAQLERAARGAARAKNTNEARAEKPRSTVRWDDDGDLVLTLRLPAHEGVAVLAALEQHQAAAQVERDERLAGLAAELAGEADPEGSAAVAAELAAEDAADVTTSGASVSAETPSVLPDPGAYLDPPFPDIPGRPAFTPYTPAEQAALDRWWAEHHRLSALRDAAREQAERLQAEAAARQLPTGRANLADGLVRALLRPGNGHTVKLQLLADPVSGWARTRHDELLPPSTVGRVVRMLPSAPGRATLEPTQHDQGRRSRVVMPALRNLLGQVDGERCRLPGCDRTRYLHAHHVRFWRNGGETDLSNLLLLCGRHHRLLYQKGYQLTLGTDRSLTVRTADGERLEHQPTLPGVSAETLPLVSAGTVASEWDGERMDLRYVVSVLLQHAA